MGKTGRPGVGRQRRPGWRLAGGLLVGVLLLGACTGGEAGDVSATPSPTSAPARSPSPEPSPVEASPTDEDRVAAAYERYLDATVAAMAAGDPDHEGLAGAARDQGLVAAQGRVVNLTSQGRIARGELVPAIQRVELDGDRARVRDCYRVDLVEFDAETGEEVTDRGGARFAASATLERSESGWTVVGFTEGEFCVPAALATDIEARYVAFWEAVAAASDPPDPDHPALLEAAAGQQLDHLRQVLGEYREQGYVRRGEGAHHPVAVELLRGDTVAFVRDCAEPDPDGGLFDAETGERVDQEETGDSAGARQLIEARLKLAEVGWQVVEIEVVEEDSTCAPGEF